MDTGKKISLCRKEAGLSQEALADKLGISRQAVSRWETGEALPDTVKIVQLARLFNVSCDYLLMEEVEDSKPVDTESRQSTERNHIKRKQEIFRIVLGIVSVLLGLWIIVRAFRGWYTIQLFIIGVVVMFFGIYLLIAEYMRED